MRVLRLIPQFYPIISGPANQAFYISQGLEKRHIKSPILTSDFGLKEKKLRENLNHIHCLRFKSLFNIYQYSFTPRLIQYILNEGYDIIHAHSYRNFQSDVAFFASKIKKIPFIINTHGTVGAYLNFRNGHTFRIPYALYDFLTLKSVLQRATAVIASTKQEFHELKSFKINESKIFIIPAGVKFDFPKRPLKHNSDDKLKLLFVGRISRDRRVELILKAFEILLRKQKNMELWIVGGEERRSYTQNFGYINELETLCKKLNITDNIRFTGNLPPEKLRNHYKYADIFIYTSDYENFGQTILEAGAAGLPLICTPVGVANDIILDGKTGFLINYAPREIADRIEYLLDHKNEREQFGLAIQKIVQRRYNWNKIIEKYIKLYNQLT